MDAGLSGGMKRRDFLSLVAGSIVVAPFSTALAQAESDGLIVHSEVPMNAEPTLQKLVENWMTPTDQFYIRSHAPVPDIDRSQYRLTVTGLVENELSISLDQLAGYDQTSVVATMTCAGNRRYEHSKVTPVKGVPWREGAIGNAEWSGVKLSDLLKQAGVKENARHVWFEGLDQIARDSGVIPFGASIPMAKAMADTDTMPGALVCTGMNGQALTSNHGWPVRTVVPGYIGARSVKWLGKIVVSDRPSPNHYVATAYKVVTEGTDLEWAEQGPIYRYPINSAICTPAADSQHKAGTALTVSGYALPPGRPGRTIEMVGLSTDEGETWTFAKLTSEPREYCWQLWSGTVGLTPGVKSLMVWAQDSTAEMQPVETDWNMKGYLHNAWHHVPLQIES